MQVLCSSGKSSAASSAERTTFIPVRLVISRACQLSAGTSPKSSSMEGRSSSARSRTWFTVFSASAAHRRQVLPRLGRVVGALGALRIHQDRGKRLPDLVVQLAGQGAALVFLRAQKLRGKLLQVGSRPGVLLEAPLQLALQPQRVPDRENSQQQAAPQRHPEGDHEGAPQAVGSRGHLFLDARQAALVGNRDAVRHRSAWHSAAEPARRKRRSRAADCVPRASIPWCGRGRSSTPRSPISAPETAAGRPRPRYANRNPARHSSRVPDWPAGPTRRRLHSDPGRAENPAHKCPRGKCANESGRARPCGPKMSSGSAFHPGARGRATAGYPRRPRQSKPGGRRNPATAPATALRAGIHRNAAARLDARRATPHSSVVIPAGDQNPVQTG